MGRLEKNDGDIDCRAIHKDFLEKFKSERGYKAFVNLVKNDKDKHEHKEKDELVLCFRGNNVPEAVCIYYNNHLVYEIKSNNRLTISFNHARYSKNYKYFWKKITRDYGFIPTGNRREEVVPRITVRKEGSSYSTSVGEVTTFFNGDVLNNVKNIYENCLRKMMEDFFGPNNEDFFRETANEYPEYKDKIAQTGRRKKEYLEKKRQQQLFCAMKSTQNGLFVFDMEFSQRSLPGKKKYRNEPDMLAVRFDEEGKPCAYVFVEVKCTAEACEGESGVIAHLEAMLEYSGENEYIKARRREAVLIINQYKELGLYTSLEEIKEENLETIEILFIFTDGAVSWIKKEFEKLKAEYGLEKYGDKDIHLQDCTGLEIVKFLKKDKSLLRDVH